MCWTDGSLPVHWIAPNRRAHSSAAMIVLMDGDNIQSAVESSRTRVYLSLVDRRCLCFYFDSRLRVFAFRRRLQLQHNSITQAAV